MIVEQHTNYAYKLKYMDNPTFDKVRDLSTKFYRELPQALQDELYEALNRGIDILDSEPQMTTYLYAFGKMHQAKLEYAFSKLPKEFLELPEINIIDYGCGQALGTMCYADYLRENCYSQKVKTITLIEPSEMCLRRAALHASVFFPDAEDNTINKSFDELKGDTICFDESIPTLHILSNVLDILDIDLVGFADLIKEHIKGYNQFICVGPYFNYSDKDNRMKDFLSFMQGKEIFSKPFDRFEFDKDKAWTAQVLCFSIGGMTEEELSTKVTDKDIENGVKDEFGVIYSHDRKRLLRCENEEIISYVINEGTIVICDNAFYECKSLRQVHISDSVRCIGNYSFWNCKSLRQITIPQSVTSIGEEAFWRCSSLQQVTMSNSVTYIGVYAFALCSSLQQIIIPESVTTIGDGTFHGCESLQQIFIPNTVKSIGEYAFSECESLKQIILPELITKIKYKTFYCCYSLQHINIPNSVTSIEANAFYGCAMIQLNIPNSVIRIGKAAFSNCRSIQQIIIPELVTEICDETFSECTSLQQVIIPNSVTRIGKDAFSYCLSLKQITIPNSVTSIAESTFDECSSLKQVTIPNSITCIRKFAFCGCNSLQQFIIPETVTTIEGGVFNNCYGINLTSKTSRYIVQDKLLIDKFENKIISCFGNEKVVIIPESVTSIGKCAFIYCDSIQQVVIPDSVSIIGESAFHGCDSLKQVIIPKGSKQRFLDIIQENLRDKLVEE